MFLSPVNFVRSMNTRFPFQSTAKSSINCKVTPKEKGVASGSCLRGLETSNRKCILRMVRYKLSNIFRQTVSRQPPLFSQLGFLLLASSRPSFWMNCLILSKTSFPSSSRDSWQDEFYAKIWIDQISITKGAVNRFFQGIVMKSLLILEKVIRYGSPRIAKSLGFKLTFTISTVPDQIPMFNFFVSIPSTNSPTTSLSSFYNNFSNIFIILINSLKRVQWETQQAHSWAGSFVNHFQIISQKWQQKQNLQFIMAFFGVELNAQVNRLIGQIKLTLNKNKYNPNFRTIYKSFVKYDADQTGVVSLEQFDKSLQENGIFLKKFQLQAFQKAFDQEGRVNWFGFLSVLREPMNEFRTEVVNQIFAHIDSQNTGRIHLSQLSKKFNCSQFLEYKLQQKTKQKIEKQLFGLVPLTPDGYITKQQFINFYNDLSLNILEDATFAKFVSSHWKYEYKAKPTLSVEEVKEAIRIIRFKLVQMTGGTHEQYILKQVFNQFDTNKNGALCEDQLYTMLVKLEIPTETRLVKPLLKKLDKSGNGVVEYDEFKNFLFFDPYHI